MIDERWFATINCLAGTKISGDAADRLRATLGAEDEVLAYLVLRMNGFADWPNARDAFRKAVRSVIRPQPFARQSVASTENPALGSAFASATIARMRGDVPDQSATDSLMAMRLNGAANTDEPHVFILR